MKALDRRTVLRGMLATGGMATISLPLLEAMLNENGTRLANAAAPLPPLYVTWFFGNGTLPAIWKPGATGAGAAWQLSPQLTPLAEVKSHLTVISGLENTAVVAGVEHPTGSSGATTGATINGNAVRARSIDQVVADAISTGAPFRSLEIGVTNATPNGNQDSLHTVSHNGPNGRNNPEFNPTRIFDRLFTGGGPPPDEGTDTEAAKLARVRMSVLDAVVADGQLLQQRLGAADTARVEQHLEAIRAMELRLDPTGTGNPNPAVCSAPASPTVGMDERSEAPPEVNTQMVELATLALQCEQTRVLSYMFSLPAAHVYYRHLAANMNDDFHDTICHGDAGDNSNQERVNTGVMYTMRCFNEFLVKLRDTPHGASTLLDTAFIYVTSDTAWGKIHTRDEWPVLFVGKGGGLLRGDEHHNFQGESLSRALLTVARAMGSEVTEFGLDAARATEVLPGILA